MGIDIGGWVEVKPTYGQGWVGIIRLDEILNRNYDMFGCLFDVMNFTTLIALAPKRGLPDDISVQGKEYNAYMDAGGGTGSQSWVLWKEIKQVNLDDEGIDYRAQQYVRDENGNLISLNRKGSPPNTPEHVEEGTTWEVDSKVYKIHSIKRREIFEIALDWQMLFDMLRILEREYTDDKIRVVVWFW